MTKLNRYIAVVTGLALFTIRGALAGISIDFGTFIETLPDSSLYIHRIYTDAGHTTAAPLDQWLAQLIYSPDNTISVLDASNPLQPSDSAEVSLALLRPDQTAGRLRGSDYQNTDTLPSPFVNNSTVQNYAEATYGKSAGYFDNGYVYARLFYTSGTPGVGTMYYQTLVFGPTDDDLDPLPTTSLLLTDAHFDQTIVPEPGTLALLGIGVAVIAVRRRMRK